MKKSLYTFLCLSLLFAACSKDTYNQDASLLPSDEQSNVNEKITKSSNAGVCSKCGSWKSANGDCYSCDYKMLLIGKTTPGYTCHVCDFNSGDGKEHGVWQCPACKKYACYSHWEKFEKCLLCSHKVPKIRPVCPRCGKKTCGGVCMPTECARCGGVSASMITCRGCNDLICSSHLHDGITCPLCGTPN